MGDKNTRSIVKAITWRVFATLITMLLVFFITKEVALSFGIGILDVFYKLLFYYFHERTWNHIKWGKDS
ncbi:DUF2061 domain-containing protein [Candidatus Woesearchaeota archaeon]|jgi:uncharacterized membrane protein|nr:DUF2061 domain-containing protein [Candidatus Woesearchaeota archaeon]MBT4322084.1 DUF2061 domain-containing protein [Candidatus Woesearchaeota archaeon]MBT4630661.1 DUF2061 domain-containing protein [Candidatus Woesearchaeota archaeon]